MTTHTERIAIVGDGNVGRALAQSLLKTAHRVVFAVRSTENDESRLKSRADGSPDAVDAIPRLPLATAMSDATIVFLAVPSNAAEDALRSAQSLKNVVVVDCTNPVRWDNGPVVSAPTAGSVAQQLAIAFPDAMVCKGFNHFGAEIHANPALRYGPADAYFAGDNNEAKARVIAVANAMGFVGHDAGPLRNASLLENLAVLWIHLATVGGVGRTFAFRQEARKTQTSS